MEFSLPYGRDNGVGSIHEWDFPHFIPCFRSGECERSMLSSYVISYYSLCQFALLTLTGHRNVQRLQPSMLYNKNVVVFM